jgi:ATP-dependent helicase/nuclease subunit A
MQRARLTTAQLVERAWRTLGGDAWLTGPELINARRYFQLLDEMEAELGAGRIDPILLDARLQRLYAEPAHFAESEAHVDLMTIHGAKGLEWDVVFVPALERSPGINRGRLLTWSELDSSDSDGDAAPIMLAPIAAKGEEIDALTAWLKGIYREREAAERKRLFYVASTRAREELHLLAAPDLLANGNINPRWDSLLKSAWPAAEPHVDAALAAAAQAPSRGVVVFPVSPEPQIFDLAAVAEAAHPILHRLPLTFDPTARFATARPLPSGDQAAQLATETSFTRPEGSFAARSFGNVVHIFLELLATRIAAGIPPAKLLAELTAWTPRIAAILRADGLPPTTVDRYTRETRTALENLLRDPDGLWLLTAHPAAASELALTAHETTGDTLASIRIDRIFHAGPEPHASGDNILWIVDYKTADHGSSGLDDFLTQQRAAYAPQLETYTRILAPAHSKSLNEVRLALYYPAIPKLIWWKPDSE